MSKILNVTINGKVCEARKGEYILEVARRNQILIPSFCHHEALPELGCCRLCVVEVHEAQQPHASRVDEQTQHGPAPENVGKSKNTGAAGKPRVVASCVYPVSKDCEVYTESDKIKGIRRTVLSMLRGCAPEGNRIASLCKIYGVSEEERYAVSAVSTETGNAKKRLQSACILCGLCVEACSRLGTGAISSVGRGTGKKISTPYDEASPDCVGCASCAAVCPTGAIACDEDAEKGLRSIWGKTFTLARCEKCGNPFATAEEIAHAAARLGAAGKGAAQTDAAALCETCRRRKSGDVLAAAFGV
jgi:NADH dehydrogenase/NADH:ubiquinone oxidoreductase subunit G